MATPSVAAAQASPAQIRTMFERDAARKAHLTRRPVRMAYLKALRTAMFYAADPSISAKSSMEFWLKQADGHASELGQSASPLIKKRVFDAYQRTEPRRRDDALATAFRYAGEKRATVTSRYDVLAWYEFARLHHRTATGEEDLPAGIKTELVRAFDGGRPARVRRAFDTALRQAADGTAFGDSSSAWWLNQALGPLQDETLFGKPIESKSR